MQHLGVPALPINHPGDSGTNQTRQVCNTLGNPCEIEGIRQDQMLLILNVLKVVSE